MLWDPKFGWAGGHCSGVERGHFYGLRHSWGEMAPLFTCFSLRGISVVVVYKSSSIQGRFCVLGSKLEKAMSASQGMWLEMEAGRDPRTVAGLEAHYTGPTKEQQWAVRH